MLKTFESADVFIMFRKLCLSCEDYRDIHLEIYIYIQKIKVLTWFFVILRRTITYWRSMFSFEAPL